MKFDREAAGGGVEAACRLENGKAVLEWRFSFTETEGAAESEGMKGIAEAEGVKRAAGGETMAGAEEMSADESVQVRIRLVDREGCLAAECIQDPYEEEALQSILVQPHLWSGVRYPYLYHMEAVLTDGNGRRLDRMCRQLPLRSIKEKRGEEGLLLNEVPVALRIVRYPFPPAASGAALQQAMMEDLKQLLAVGANAVSVDREKAEFVRTFQPLCDRAGLLLCFDIERGSDGEMPVFRGRENCFFLPGSKCPTSLFYRYKARWSQEPFVYIVPESVRKLESGNYAASCYSNCSRVALYSDGVLFEFQRGEGEFVFREFPAKGPCVMLTAEGDGCSESLSLHKTYLRKGS